MNLSNEQGRSHEGDPHLEPEKLLQQPSFFMLALAESLQSDLAFFSEDIAGNFVYLSKSADQVLGNCHQHWIGRSLCEALTDAPCNEEVRNENLTGNVRNEAISRSCEILNREGVALKIQYWKTRITHRGEPIGAAGILQRVEESSDLTDTTELLKKTKSLSEVERHVIELVVDGNMNKTIAGMLDVAVRTVESRRSRAMTKLDAKSLSELVRIWMQVRNAESRMGITWRRPELPGQQDLGEVG